MTPSQALLESAVQALTRKTRAIPIPEHQGHHLPSQAFIDLISYADGTRMLLGIAYNIHQPTSQLIRIEDT